MLVPPAPAALGIPVTKNIADILRTIRILESNETYGIPKNRGGASGAYQYIDPTWNNYMGYPSAYLAPPEIQDQKAALDVNSILATWGGDVSMVPVIWYYPKAAYDPTLMDLVPMPGAGNVLTVRDYQTRWLRVYSRVTGTQVNAAEPAPVHVSKLTGEPPALQRNWGPFVQIAYPLLGPSSVAPPLCAPTDAATDPAAANTDVAITTDECRVGNQVVINGQANQPVVAVANGVITDVTGRVAPGDPPAPLVGLTIIDGDGRSYSYSGFNDGSNPAIPQFSPLVEVGARVRAGQVIGYLGGNDADRPPAVPVDAPPADAVPADAPPADAVPADAPPADAATPDSATADPNAAPVVDPALADDAIAATEPNTEPTAEAAIDTAGEAAGNSTSAWDNPSAWETATPSSTTPDSPTPDSPTPASTVPADAAPVDGVDANTPETSIADTVPADTVAPDDASNPAEVAPNPPQLRLTVSSRFGAPLDSEGLVNAALIRQSCDVAIGPWATLPVTPAGNTTPNQGGGATGLPTAVQVIGGSPNDRWLIATDGAVSAQGLGAMIVAPEGCPLVPADLFGPGAVGPESPESWTSEIDVSTKYVVNAVADQIRSEIPGVVPKIHR